MLENMPKNEGFSFPWTKYTKSKWGLRSVAFPRTLIAPSDLPTAKLVTNGNGKVWAVDENGKPLGIFTKSHVTLV